MEYLTNNNYKLTTKRINKLIATYEKCLSNFGIVTAVRIDLGIKTKLAQEELDIYELDIKACYETLHDRLRKHLNGKGIKHMRNWKLEHEEKKGLHLHTLYYFDYASLRSLRRGKGKEVFDYMKEEWDKITHGHGVIQLCTSCTSKENQKFGVTNEYTDENNKQYETILVSDIELLDTLEVTESRLEYLKQKNTKDKTYGWFYWISYLAKSEQSAKDYSRKCFG
jgi:hypothetical protein